MYLLKKEFRRCNYADKLHIYVWMFLLNLALSFPSTKPTQQWWTISTCATSRKLKAMLGTWSSVSKTLVTKLMDLIYMWMWLRIKFICVHVTAQIWKIYLLLGYKHTVVSQTESKERYCLLICLQLSKVFMCVASTILIRWVAVSHLLFSDFHNRMLSLSQGWFVLSSCPGSATVFLSREAKNEKFRGRDFEEW
jgi:hypothetical protein